MTLKTTITEPGKQDYLDTPVFKEVPVYCGTEPITHPELQHYERTPLRWMRPNGKGGLVPK